MISIVNCKTCREQIFLKPCAARRREQSNPALASEGWVCVSSKMLTEKEFCSVRGFTLVEMIIYIAFFAMLSLLAMQATLTVMRSFYVIRLTQNINQSATVALERMSREVRNAYDVDETQSMLGSSPGRLTLKTKDALGANTTIEFYVSSGQARIKDGGVDKGPLLTKNTTVTNIVFRKITTLNSQAVKIEMTLRDARGAEAREAKFYDTIVLRGSAH